VGKISQGLYHLSQLRFGTFKQCYRKDYGRRHADQQFPETVKESIPQKLNKIEGFDKGAEMPQPYPLTANHSVIGHKISERNLSVPDWDIFENDIISQGNDKEDIYRLVPFDCPESEVFISFLGLILHDVSVQVK
jgi:hypothetical protein